MTVVFLYQVLNYFIVSFCSFLFLNFKFQLKIAPLDPVERALYKCLIIIIVIIIIIIIISNGNRTEWSPIRSVIILVINKIGRPVQPPK